jgi:hypothetical protein
MEKADRAVKAAIEYVSNGKEFSVYFYAKKYHVSKALINAAIYLVRNHNDIANDLLEGKAIEIPFKGSTVSTVSLVKVFEYYFNKDKAL